MFEGKIVVTSNELFKAPKSLTPERMVKRNNVILWKFKTVDDAIRATKVFMDAGFESVRRIV